MMLRISSKTGVVLSTESSLTLRMSRIAPGEVANTIGGINQRGPSVKAVTGPAGIAESLGPVAEFPHRREALPIRHRVHRRPRQ